MGYKHCLLILAFVGLAELQSVKNGEKIVEYNITKSGCEFPFENVNNGCYYFSDEKMNFEQASDYCEGLTHGHVYEISMAMLGYDNEEDQSLLDNVASRDTIYWIGGKTDDTVHWFWIDNREIYLQDHFWDWYEPNDSVNKCMTIQNNINAGENSIRAAAYDYTCSDSLNFICQTGGIKCPTDFIKIENHCYLQSWSIGVPALSWEHAQTYCQSLSVPIGYHADLAVIGLQDQNDYYVMNNLLENHEGDTWIGAYRDSQCHYLWVDGRELPLNSIYWYPNNPDCTSNVVSLYNSGSRTALYDLNDRVNPFVCQMFKQQ